MARASTYDRTPELTPVNCKSQFREFTGELTLKVDPTTSHVVNGSNCRNQLRVEESRVERQRDSL